MFAKIADGQIVQYPYTWADLRADNPNVSFPRHMTPEQMAEFGMVHVVVTGQPAFDPLTEHVTEGTPALVDGQWQQTWNVEAL